MENLLLHLLQSAGLLAVFYLVYQLLLRNDTSFRANRHFLLGGIFAAAVLPFVKFTRTVIVETPVPLHGFPITTEISEIPIEQSPLSVWEIAGYVYAAVALFLFLRFLLQLFSLLKILSTGKTTREGRLRIVTTSRPVLPFSFFHYIVYNPEEHPVEELKIILEHEKTHASQWHSADVLLANFSCAILWFSPFAWWYRKSLVQNLEYLADRGTVTSVSRKEYQHVLVKTAIATHQPVLANNFYQSLIKKRILMLNKNNSKNRSLLKMGAIVPLLMGFMVLFNVETKAQVTDENGKVTQISAEFMLGSDGENLEEIVDHFAKYGVQLEFKILERNAEGLISKISVQYRTHSSQGNFQASDPDGIETLTIVSNEDKTYVTTASIETKPPSGPLKNIGEAPLFIIKGKEYTTRDLSHKIIHLDGPISTLTGEDAEKYGSKAADGVIIVPAGEILDSLGGFSIASLKEGKQFIRVNNRTKPFLFNTKKKKTTGSTHVEVKQDKDSVTEKKENGLHSRNPPLIVINGEIMPDDFDIQTVDHNTIAELHVLKDTKTNEKYGDRAKNGVIEIITKKNPSAKDENQVYSSILLGKDKKTGDPVYTQTIAQYLEVDESNAPLYIVDGKTMDEDFDVDQISPEDIKSIDVIKGEGAKELYGEKGTNGVILISLKK